MSRLAAITMIWFMISGLFAILWLSAPASASTSYTQLEGNLYRIAYTDELPEGDRQTWQVAIRGDQDIATIASEMETNYLQRGDPNAYVLTGAQLLEKTRTNLVQDVRSEGLRRIQQYEPGVTNFDVLKLVADLWPGLTSANLSGDIVTAKDIYQEAKAAIQWLNDAARTQQELDAYDVSIDPGWSG